MFNLLQTPRARVLARKVAYRLVLVLSLWMTVFSTGMAALSLGCGGSAGISAATGGDIGTDLTSTDSQLYDEGPVDMPVTIAKLDSPDLTKVSVTVEEITTPSISPPLATTTLYRFTIIGAPAATNTAKIFVYDVTTGDTASADVATDYSFTVSIDAASLTDSIAFAGGNSELSQISPPYVINVVVNEDLSVSPVVALTNSSSLNSNQNILVDAVGNYYLSSSNTDGTYTLSRRSATGTQLEIIAPALNSPPRIVFSSQGGSVMVILEDGTILGFDAPLSALTIPTLARSKPAFTDWTENSIGSISGGLVAANATFGTGYSMAQNSEDGTAISYPLINPVTAESNLNLLKITDSSGVSSVDLIPASTYDGINIQSGPDDKLYMFLKQAGMVSSDLVSMDFVSPSSNGNGAVLDSWAARTTHISGLAAYIISFTVADNADVAYTYVTEENGFPLNTYWNSTAGVSQTWRVTDENISRQYFNATLTPASEIVIMCDVGESTSDVPALVYWRVGDATNDVHDLVRFTDAEACNQAPGTFFVSTTNLLYFYKRSGTVDPQLSVIDLNQIPGLLTQ